MSFSYASTEFLLYSYAGIITRISSINFFIRPVNRIRQSDSTKKEKCRRRNSQMERIVFFFRKSVRKNFRPFFEKVREKERFALFRKPRKTFLHLFSKRCSKKRFSRMWQFAICLHLFSKRCAKKMKGEELSAVPLPFNSLSFKRFRASP